MNILNENGLASLADSSCRCDLSKEQGLRLICEMTNGSSVKYPPVCFQLFGFERIYSGNCYCHKSVLLLSFHSPNFRFKSTYLFSSFVTKIKVKPHTLLSCCLHMGLTGLTATAQAALLLRWATSPKPAWVAHTEQLHGLCAFFASLEVQKCAARSKYAAAQCLNWAEKTGKFRSVQLSHLKSSVESVSLFKLKSGSSHQRAGTERCVSKKQILCLFLPVSFKRLVPSTGQRWTASSQRSTRQSSAGSPCAHHRGPAERIQQQKK